MLPEDVLLEIFDFYRLDAMKQSQGRPWKWHRLAHVCQKWRDLISMSTRRLDLRILCESGVPIGNILASWPTLPIVAILDAGRKSKTVPRNVMAALRCPDRLCEIGLRVTSPMLASIVEVIQKPCQALERIRITVQAPTGPSESMPVCNAFLGGSAPHLSEIKLDGIAFPFPSIRQVLLSTNNLVELHLAKIPNEAYFSPNELVTGLSTLAQLKHLTIDFHFPASSSPPSIAVARPLAQRTTLPSLISLDFHGASGYLEEFVSWIDLPVLCKITAMLFNDIFFEIPEFCKFILRLNALRSPTRVIVKHSMDFVGVFLEEGQTLRESCFLGTSCRQLDWQLSFVTEIISQLSSHLSSVHSLFIQSGEELPTWEDADSTPSQWLELLRPFTHVTQVHVREQLVPRIVEALVAEEMTADVFPELTLLHLDQYLNSASVEKAVDQFVATREVSGRTVTLTSGDKVSHFLLPYYHTGQLDGLPGFFLSPFPRTLCAQRLWTLRNSCGSGSGRGGGRSERSCSGSSSGWRRRRRSSGSRDGRDRRSSGFCSKASSSSCGRGDGGRRSECDGMSSTSSCHRNSNWSGFTSGGRRMLSGSGIIGNNSNSDSHSLNEYRSHHSITPNLVSSVFLRVRLSLVILSLHRVPHLCACHTPSSSYFAPTGRFYWVCCLARPRQVFIFLIMPLL